MRVVQLGPWPPPHGGVQTNMVSIRRCLREHGHFDAVINLTRFRGEPADDVYYPESGLEVLRLLHHLRPDIIHLHIGGALTRRLLGLAAVTAAAPGSRSVLTFHSGGYPSSPEGLNARPETLRGWVFRRFDRIIAVNPAIAEMFGRFGALPGRVRLIYPHEIPAVSRAPYPNRLGRFVASHQPLLLTVGLLEPEYDLALQIDILGAVREQFPNAGLVIAGAGSLERELREHIASKPWRDHVLLWGDMPHEVALRAIGEASALLRTTLYDGDSIAVREALALGAPVIATDNGMRPAGVRLIPARDHEALRVAIAAAVSAPRPAAPAASDAPSNIRAVLELYRELTSS